ncbi:MAG: RNase H family protein [Acidimicrobiia bacterium]
MQNGLVYTDGACSGNPGPGGWAWAVAPAGPFAAGAEASSTNQRMEIRAVLEALRALDGTVEVRSDSTYVVNCFRDRWWEGWLRRGWVNSQKKPVANRDLWEPLIALYRDRRGEITFTWVKGHSGDPMNDAVDRLAVEAALSGQARAGERLPDLDELGPPDQPGGAKPTAAARDRRLPAGRLVGVFGHRPTELGGYGENLFAASVRRRLADILAAKREMHPDLAVLSGLALGAEQLGAEAAAEAGVPYVAVQPYPEPDRLWPRSSRDSYAKLVASAERTVLLEKKSPESKQQAGQALARRDAWLARAVDEAVVVWDGSDPLLGRLFRTLEDRLGDDVWVVNPLELG